ncbi:USG protein [Pseudomonas monteilii SB3101]|uniref:NAD(+) hydrolase ThsA n=1 Tax=Pseudomonas monteilii SB3101 TaxID=1435058 RepID=V9UUN5_9PSED|nr:SIR2 family protein [Pseudomonas monteilii]AHC80715.1 USG protein [Pseudomonas monteilii SB3078]AHC86147.1 USG protein [Pseudomonas monteilii SB3101]
MKFNGEINSFIRDFVKDLSENNAAIFAGAGLSKSSGYVNWKELLTDIAEELELKIDLESDLISLAQYHVNKTKGPAKLTRKIVEEFSHQAEPSENHKILARLPIRTFWTTNYDTLIEDSLKQAYKVADVKHKLSQLNITRPKRDAVVYKMHGCVSDATHAILYKNQYETYHRDYAPFVTALSGDLVSKTFLFIGFSFSDPNLDYVLSRLHTSTIKTHYCFVKREDAEPGDDEEMHQYKRRKQEFRVEDLRRYGIQPIMVDKYSDITEILREIERRYLKKTVFISGSAEVYGEWGRDKSLKFIHALASELVLKDRRVVNGFGWGVGSAVINGALDAIYKYPEKYSEDQLVMRPFPQFPSAGQDLKQLWEEYRQRMIGLSGVSIFIFGNKIDNEQLVIANGVVREAEIAIEQGRIVIPVAATGFAAAEVYNLIKAKPELYDAHKWLLVVIDELADPALSCEEIVKKIADAIVKLDK